MKNLEQFRELFKPLPGNHYLEVTSHPKSISSLRAHVDAIATLLSSMMQEVGGKFNLVVYSKEDLEFDSTDVCTTLQHVKDFDDSFRALPRNHDAVILKDILSKHHKKEMILKLAYLTLANSASIVIIEKKGVMDIELIKAMLEEHEFRASNSVEIFDEYDLVIAKKMHMWGNGL